MIRLARMSNLDQYNRRPSEADSTTGRRSVPVTTRAAMLFGGFPVQFGAAFFTFGMIFWWVFGAQSDVTSWYQFSGELQRTEGTVVSCTDTGISEGGSDSRPGTPIYQIDYEYLSPKEMRLSGTCYATGMNLVSGAPVTIEYVPDDPATSRIPDTRKNVIGFWGIFVGLFPAIGLAFLFVGLRSNARSLRVLKIGKQARGRLISKEPTNTRINKQTVYKLTFEYEDANGDAHSITTKTHLTAMLEDEETERLLYDPMHPSEGVLVDNLHGKPAISARGDVLGVGVSASLGRMLLPVGGFIAHAGVGVIFYVL